MNCSTMASQRVNESRITVFLPALHGGGAERTMVSLANGMAAGGQAVDLLVAQAVGPYQSEVDPRVRLVDLKATSTLASLPRLVRYLKRERPAAMVSALSRANITALVARKLAGAPATLLVCEQNTLSQWARKSRNWRFRWVPILARLLYRQADFVIGVSQGVADDLTNKLGISSHKVRVIYNPGITPQLRAKAEERLDHPWFRPGSEPVILTVGSLTPQKDQATLLKAFAELRQRRRCKLLILGEGKERESLEKMITRLGLDEHVSLPGFTGNPYPYMKRGTAFVLSSRWEGLPTVLVEAMYCGLPLVATDCPSGPREILKDGVYGELVPVGQPGLLAQAMERALDRVGAPPAQDAWQRFSLETVTRQYLELLLPELDATRDQQQVNGLPTTGVLG